MFFAIFYFVPLLLERPPNLFTVFAEIQRPHCFAEAFCYTSCTDGGTQSSPQHIGGCRRGFSGTELLKLSCDVREGEVFHMERKRLIEYNDNSQGEFAPKAYQINTSNCNSETQPPSEYQFTSTQAREEDPVNEVYDDVEIKEMLCNS